MRHKIKKAMEKERRVSQAGAEFLVETIFLCSSASIMALHFITFHIKRIVEEFSP
jgi:hypothetical protein